MQTTQKQEGKRRAFWAALGKGLGSFQAGSSTLCLGLAWTRS